MSKKGLMAASKAYPDAQEWLSAWLAVAGKATWTNLVDVRETYRSADQYRQCLIFDVKGNTYRLIARVVWANPPRTNGTLFIKAFLAHADYDKDTWKGCC